MLVEFYVDLSCPYAYLASEVIEATCARHGAALRWRPMLLGGVFRAIGPGAEAEGDGAAGPMARLSPARVRHVALDAHRWASRRGVPLAFPAGHPRRTVRALRVLLGLPEARWAAAFHGLYRAYWRDGLDVAQDEVIAAALTDAGIPAAERDAALAGAETPEIKAELRRRTDEAVGRGVFGAPAMFVHVDGRPPVMLWGQDRLHWLEAVLDGWRPDDGAPGPARRAADPAADQAPGASPPALEFWFDFSSPFAYLGATQVARVAAAAGASLAWRPLLLGGLFRELGTPDVPLLAMPEPKRRYVAQELERWARWWGVPYRMNSRFPVRTVTALRLVLAAAPATRPALIQRLFQAVWADDEDVNDEATLRRIAEETGAGADAVERTRSPELREALIDETAAARAAGVFGVPTCLLRDGHGAPRLFWGQDRLDLLAAALRGWRDPAGL